MRVNFYLFVILLFVNFALAAPPTGNVTLSGDQNYTGNTPTPSPQNWVMTTEEDYAELTLKGDGTATINAVDETTTLKMGRVQTGVAGANLIIGDTGNANTTQVHYNGYHTINMAKNLTINDEATFKAILNGKNLPDKPDGTKGYQGSEYGGSSKFRVERDRNVVIGKNAKLIVTYDKTGGANGNTYFVSDGSITLREGATLDVEVRNGADLANGGNIRIHNGLNATGATIKFKGHTYNVGRSDSAGINSITSEIVLDNSTLEIDGNFINGGRTIADKLQPGGFAAMDPEVIGGGKVTLLNGAVLKISGNALSEKGKDISGATAANIEVRGGTLEVGGTLINRDQSSLTFGYDQTNGQMGKLVGNLQNQNTGGVKIDIENAPADTPIKVIEGNVSGVNKIAVVSGNGANTLMDVSYNDGEITLSRTPAGQTPTTSLDNVNSPVVTPPAPPSGGGSGSGTGGSSGGTSGGAGSGSASGGSSGNGGNSGGVATLYDTFKATLPQNNQALLDIYEKKFAGKNIDIATLGTEKLAQATNDVNASVEQNFIASPNRMISSFKADTNLAPFTQVSATSAPIASIASDAIPNPIEFQAKRNIYVSPFGGILRGDDESGDIKGHLFGLSVGTTFIANNHSMQVQASYANATQKQSSPSNTAETDSNMAALAFYDRIKYGRTELDVKTSAMMAKFDTNRNTNFGAMDLYSSGDFSAYEFNLGANVGYRFGDKLTFKPYVGIENYLQKQNSFDEQGDGAMFHSEGYNRYVLNGVVGAEARYQLSDTSAIYAKANYEAKLHNSQKSVLFRAIEGTERLQYTNEYDNTASFLIGAQGELLQGLILSFELLSRYYNSGMQYYGGALLLKYSF